MKLLNIIDGSGYDPIPQFAFMRSLLSMQQCQAAVEELKKEGELDLAGYWEYVGAEQARIASCFQNIQNEK